MLLDNKTQKENGELYKVFDFIRKYTESGDLDAVTGFFSVNALALLKDEINDMANFRLVLGNLMNDENEQNKAINLLNGDAGIMSTLNLSQNAKKAIDFLKQDKVELKTVQKNFCHAKSYIYKDTDSRKNYQIIGSSNLTDAGLGMRESGNVELNVAAFSDNTDWQEVKKWFENLWKNVASDKIERKDKTKTTTKDFIIELISNLFKEYSPEDLYYKVLYEMFKKDLDFSTSEDFKREMKHLSETVVYQTLYPYQQKGVISLIKMLQNYNGAILA
ncbi:MAG: phospholipase D-like domain-containing protein, partial [Prevotella sp.]|nr:phospholipase D-like domain-containing protein [Prevotella sp.]